MTASTQSPAQIDPDDAFRRIQENPSEAARLFAQLESKSDDELREAFRNPTIAVAAQN